ncbi:DUF6695 family protein [Psychroserpens sp.]|uniref:DUF6695 family protein n=1 Tax=Psychroserpens sp. TaxID=2020870 RepID=UPI001B289A95|nr:DUF6695 family protein [Psychroserpens sp.]MBO6605903.1 hypothetical protein [Psychroserpens sp.]MBO6630678.1 hypothetical protein [Psychroserpens sp.]MBO6652726.1 hypothetical protein [Psychroserpens sp.]MBO6681502.1 hypothetical protein [Psychroserpens sp.]MBO6749277.1 hypothetical protein [Psychroserpens sp.]
MNDGIILTLAYPETIVSHAEEWYSPLLKYISIGNKKHVRAGHAALVLIDKKTGVLEYHDFGRYITSSPNGRVRGRETDFELNFPLIAEFENDKIKNLDSILKFLATHPKLTHGDGQLYSSVCDAIDYSKARQHITMMQQLGFIRYAAFISDACNCARFVTDSLIASVTDADIKSKLIKSKRFTPSTIGNVVLADTENDVYVVTELGEITEFKSTVSKENRRLFLDTLVDYAPSLTGTIEPKDNHEKQEHAQWLGGIAAGAWFELHPIGSKSEIRFRRISSYGNIDCDAIYKILNTNFNQHDQYAFVHYSNCNFFHIEQASETYRFEFIEHYT